MYRSKKKEKKKSIPVMHSREIISPRNKYIFKPRSESYESNREYQTTRTRFHSKAGIVGTRVTDVFARMY